MVENTQEIQNLELPSTQELLNKFKNRDEMTVVDTAEIIAKLITTLRVDKDKGRPKYYTISVSRLGDFLGIGQGVISQYMSVWNMPQESKDFLKNYDLSLLNAYYISRSKGKDIPETIKIQKDLILEKSMKPSRNGKRTDLLLHSINQAKVVLEGIVSSNKIPKEIFLQIPPSDNNQENLQKEAKIYIQNIEKCINYISPKILKLSYLQKQIEFCTSMIENKETQFCGKDISTECLQKQIEFIRKEIFQIESEKQLPHISSLIMMKNNIEKNI